MASNGRVQRAPTLATLHLLFGSSGCINIHSQMRLLLLASFLLLICQPAALLAQTLQGTVQRDSTAAPVPFASVGVQGKTVGTVADAQGRFSIPNSPALAATDSVIISCVGYQPTRLLVQQLQEPVIVRLRRQPQVLREVVVRGKQPKQVRLGHKGISTFTSLTFYTQADTVPHARLGREIGVLLPVKHPTQLESFHLFTFGRDFKSVMLRLNVYSVENGQPKSTLLQQDIVFTLNGQQRGWTTVDLRPYGILLDGPQQVVATVQWLTSEAGRPNSRFLNIPAHLSLTHTTFRRDKSQADWLQLGANPSLYFTGLSW